MARPLRVGRTGGWYHITSRGNERRPIYRQDRDREHVCELLSESGQPLRLSAARLGRGEVSGRAASANGRGRAGTASQPDVASVIACVERERGGKWEEFRDRHGDRGRDLVLYFGRRFCGLTLDELARSGAVDGSDLCGTPV